MVRFVLPFLSVFIYKNEMAQFTAEPFLVKEQPLRDTDDK
jgi:hypothetical protein